MAELAEGLGGTFGEAQGEEVRMGAPEELTEAGVIAIVSRIGLDVERLRRDMEDPAIGAYLDETARLAGAFGIRGTPAFVIGDAWCRAPSTVSA